MEKEESLNYSGRFNFIGTSCRNFVASRRVFVGGIIVTPLSAQGFWRSTPKTFAEVDALIQSRFPNVPHLSTEELTSLQERKVRLLIVDVREPKEFAVSHITNARRFANIEQVIETVKTDAPERIVLYCSVGYRSAQWVQQMQGRGIANVQNLRGSLFLWANQGRPVVSNGSPTRWVHPYDKEWGKLLNSELHWSAKAN